MRFPFQCAVRLFFMVVIGLGLIVLPIRSADMSKDPSLRHSKKQHPLIQVLEKHRFTLDGINPTDFEADRPIVIFIQDIHSNESAQKEISGVTRQGIEEHSIDLVALEGAYGPLPLSGFRFYEDQKTIRDVADDLFRKNKISGPVHAALTVPGPIPPMIGVDDPYLYRSHVRSYREASAWSPTVKKKNKAWEDRLTAQSQRVCSAPLRDMGQRIQAYRQEKVPFAEHVQSLARALPRSRWPDPVALYLQSKEIEASLRPLTVEQEKANLIQHLLLSCTIQEKNEALEQAKHVGPGEMSANGYFRLLMSLSKKHGLDWGPFPSFQKYVEASFVNERIRPHELWAGVQRMETECLRRLALSKEEKEWVDEFEQLWLAQQLAGFSLTADGWVAARDRLDLFNSPEWGPFLSFYREARLRDRALSENLLAEIRRHRARSVLFVAGGFHTRGVVDKLRQEGVSVWVAVPKVELNSGYSSERALSVFVQETGLFQKTVPGATPFLAPPPAAEAVLKGEAVVAVLGLKELENGSKGLESPSVIAEKLGAPADVQTEDEGPGRAVVHWNDSEIEVVRGNAGVDLKEFRRDLYAKNAITIRAIAELVDGLHDEKRADSIGRGLLGPLSVADRVPDDLMKAMAVAMARSRGETKRNLINGLIQALGKDPSPPVEVVKAVVGALFQSSPDELMYVAHGLAEGAERAHGSPTEVLEALEQRRLFGENLNGPTQSFFKRVQAQGVFQRREAAGGSAPFQIELGDFSKWSEKVFSLGVLRGDALEDLVREIGPLLFQQINGENPLVNGLWKKIDALGGRQTQPWERVYFLNAAAQGNKFLSRSLQGFQQAIMAMERLPQARRYDMPAQVARWGRENRLLRKQDWAMWADPARLSALSLYLSPEEYEGLGNRPLPPGPEGKWQLLRDAIEENAWVWESNFRRLFMETAREVGLPAVFRYVGRERHRSILEDNQQRPIAELLGEFLPGLDPVDRRAFIHNVFAQVSMDKSVDYQGKDARAQWVNIVKDLVDRGPDWQRKVESPNISDAFFNSIRMDVFTHKGLFQSWRQFKRLRFFLMASGYQSMTRSVSTLLDGSPAGQRLYDYVAALFLHPGMSDYKAVQEWLEAITDNKSVFFERRDEIVHRAHEEKKASRYFDFARIDLTPSLLARGLILGRLEKIQSFRPFSVDYYPAIGFSDELDRMTAKMLVDHLNKHRDVDRILLQRAIQSLLLNLHAELTGPVSNPLLTDRARQSALGAVRNAHQWVSGGMRGDAPRAFGNPIVARSISFSKLIDHGCAFEGTRYRISILPKSNPQAALTGNEAPSCMGFGQGNNTSYLFNPNDGFLTLSREIIDESGRKQERVLATSVLTLDRKVNRLDGQGGDRGSPLTNRSISYREQFGEDFLSGLSGESYFGVDNVEGAPSEILNGEADTFASIVEAGYSRFFSAYLGQYPQTSGGRRFNRTFVPVGFSHSDFLQFLPRIPNNFISAAPDAHSDKIGANVGAIELKGGADESGSLSIDERMFFVRPILAEDILEVGALEELAPKRVHKGPVEVQNEIIASLTNGAIQGEDREFLGTALFNHGRMIGYILAYAGVSPDLQREEIFVSDYVLGAEWVGSTAARQFMDSFLQRVQFHARSRADRGKNTFLAFEQSPDAESFYNLWLENRDRWENQWGLTESHINGNHSDRITMILKVLPTDRTPPPPLPETTPPGLLKEFNNLKTLSHQS